MPRKKRRSLADTLRESGESHEKTLAEASKVIRLIEKDDSQRSLSSEDAQQTSPADQSNGQDQHPTPINCSNIQNQQSEPTLDFDSHYQQADPAQQTNTPSQRTTPTDDTDAQTQHTIPTGNFNSQSQQAFPSVGTNSQYRQSDLTDDPDTQVQPSDGSECWNQQLTPTEGPLESTDKPNRQTQQTDSQTAFLLSARPKLIKTKNQRVLYKFLSQNPQIITSYDSLSDHLEISNGTIRDILRKFERNGLISKEKYVSKNGVQGLYIKFQQAYPADNSNRQAQQLDLTVDSPSKIDRSICLSQEGGPGGEGEEKTQPDCDPSPEDRLKKLSDNDIAFFWPNIHKSGFGIHQIQQVIDRLAKVGKQPDKVMRGLDHAEYELENGTMADKEGNAVKDPCSYVFNSLAKHGYYRRPSGYVSPEEQAEIDAKEEVARREKLAREKAERLVNAAKEEKHAKFLEWKASLSEEELNKILENKQQRGPDDPWLKQYWENNC